MRGFHHFCINDSIYLIYIYQEFNIGPASHMNMLVVWVSLVWVERHYERQKRPDRLWDAVSELLVFIFFPYS